MWQPTEPIRMMRSSISAVVIILGNIGELIYTSISQACCISKELCIVLRTIAHLILARPNAQFHFGMRIMQNVFWN